MGLLSVFSRFARTLLALAAPLVLMAAGEDSMEVRRTGPATWGLIWRGKVYRCAVGRTGIAKEGQKREGDGHTPAGSYELRRVLFRPDRVDRAALATGLPTAALARDDGWCDAPGDRNYNKPVKLPYPASHEELWREKDELYNMIIPLGYNDDPVVPGLGSAIFLHVARADYSPTAGCVAVSKQDLLEIVKTVMVGCRVRIVQDVP